MRLFEIDEESLVKLNKTWIHLIPELSAILKRDKGSPGDSEGRLKLRSRREFTFIYFFTSFESPIRDWEESERRKEAYLYAGIDQREGEKDEVLQAANSKYEEIMLASARSMATYKALLLMLDEMDNYLRNINFKEKDKKGELVHDPVKVATMVEKLGKVYEQVNSFEKRVEEELKKDTGIRGTAEKGDNEDKNRKWSESDVQAGSLNLREKGRTTELGKAGPNSKGRNFTDLMNEFRSVAPVQNSLENQEDEEDDRDLMEL